MAKIKICGLTRPEDIYAVNAVKPDYIGFVFAESRRKIEVHQAAALRELLDNGITPCGIFVNETPEAVARAVHIGAIDIIQLHGDEDEAYIRNLKTLTNAPIIKAISVQKHGDVQAWAATQADYLLLDSTGGGTGQSFDWGLIGEVEKPFFLAGGLNTDNVQTAIQTLNPFAVDVSSGAETDGRKDASKIKALVQLVRSSRL